MAGRGCGRKMELSHQGILVWLYLCWAVAGVVLKCHNAFCCMLKCHLTLHRLATVVLATSGCKLPQYCCALLIKYVLGNRCIFKNTCFGEFLLGDSTPEGVASQTGYSYDNVKRLVVQYSRLDADCIMCVVCKLGVNSLCVCLCVNACAASGIQLPTSDVQLCKHDVCACFECRQGYQDCADKDMMFVPVDKGTDCELVVAFLKEKTIQCDTGPPFYA